MGICSSVYKRGIGENENENENTPESFMKPSVAPPWFCEHPSKAPERPFTAPAKELPDFSWLT